MLKNDRFLEFGTQLASIELSYKIQKLFLIDNKTIKKNINEMSILSGSIKNPVNKWNEGNQKCFINKFSNISYEFYYEIIYI